MAHDKVRERKVETDDPLPALAQEAEEVMVYLDVALAVAVAVVQVRVAG